MKNSYILDLALKQACGKEVIVSYPQGSKSTEWSDVIWTRKDILVGGRGEDAETQKWMGCGENESSLK